MITLYFQIKNCECSKFLKATRLEKTREKLAMKINSKNWQSQLASIFNELAASKKLSDIRFNKKIYFKIKGDAIRGGEWEKSFFIVSNRMYLKERRFGEWGREGEQTDDEDDDQSWIQLDLTGAILRLITIRWLARNRSTFLPIDWKTWKNFT